MTDPIPAARVETLIRQWQPIETAPKDGTSLLLARKHMSGELIVVSGSWNSGGAMHMPHWMSPVLGFQPTHWMPLPDDHPTEKTECCGVPLAATDRFCSRCGWEARAELQALLDVWRGTQQIEKKDDTVSRVEP